MEPPEGYVGKYRHLRTSKNTFHILFEPDLSISAYRLGRLAFSFFGDSGLNIEFFGICATLASAPRQCSNSV
jgi:hypothetical protein